MKRAIGSVAFAFIVSAAAGAELPHFERMMFNNPGLETDLSLGIWPHVAAYDYDGDGRMDVVLRASGCPIRGSERRQLCRAYSDPVVPKAGIDVPVSASRQPDPRRHPDANGVKCPHPRKPNGLRANWVDLDSDGREDLVYTVSDWTHYGKVGPQCPVAYDSRGVWTNGQIETYMYFIRNLGGANVWKPQWAEPVPIVAQGDSGDVLKGPWGGDRVMFWDFDGDGDMDFIAGEFVDSFWYFENVAGKGNPPKFIKGRRVLDTTGRPLTVDLCMYDPVLVDFNGDRRPDIVAADEDGRTALYENTGMFRNGVPVFRCGRYFRQKAQELKFGCLATPCGIDWDGDGDWDFIVGNSAGYIAFIENLSGPGVERPSWAEPRYLTVGGRPIRTMAGWCNSPQGPAERKWGYSSVSVGDWDEDGILDVVSNDINGDVLFYRGRKRGGLEMEPAQPIEVEWPEGGQPQPNWEWRGDPGKRLRAQWRTTAEIRDWTGDGHLDLITPDFEGYLALYERFRGGDGKLRLKAPARCFVNGKGEPIRFSGGERGGSGRARFCSVDWDGDGLMDFLQAAFNARLLRQRGERDGVWSFDVRKRIGEEQLQGHTCCPTTVDFNADGVPDCVIAAEDGYFYYLRNPRSRSPGTKGRKSVKASDFGFDGKDSTDCLRAAIGSDAEEIVIDRQEGPWFTDRLAFTNLTPRTIRFERGVRIRAKPGCFRSAASGMSLLSFYGGEGVTLVGEDAALSMDREAYCKPPYEHSEHRHCLNLRGVRNFKVRGLRFEDSGGDGIFIGGTSHNGRFETSENVTISDVVCDRNYRQGLSVISVSNLTVTGCTFSNTRGTPPQSGVDIEPNQPYEPVSGIVFRDCRFTDNAGRGIEFYLGRHNSTSPPVDALIEGCEMTGGINGFEFQQRLRDFADLPKGGHVTVRNCAIVGTDHAGILVIDKPETSARLSFEEIRISGCPRKNREVSDIVVYSRDARTPACGGIEFRNMIRGGFMWGLMLQLGHNMWKNPADSNRTDEAVWNEVTERAAEKGANAILIDLGEGLVYPSHPELAVKGSWTPERMKREIVRLRKLGLEPLPKLNFSMMHDAWLGEYAFQTSTPLYYRVVADLIADVCRIFEHPRLFHLGWDEERARVMAKDPRHVARKGGLWWKDMLFTAEEVRKNGSQPWVWSDKNWVCHEEFLSRMPHWVMQSNWHYFFLQHMVRNDEEIRKHDWPEAWAGPLGFLELEAAKYDQIPCASNYRVPKNLEIIVRFAKAHVARERIKGFLMAPWQRTYGEKDRTVLLEACDLIANARRIWESDEPDLVIRGSGKEALDAAIEGRKKGREPVIVTPDGTFDARYDFELRDWAIPVVGESPCANGNAK